MTDEDIIRRKKGFIGSYFGLLMGWAGLLVIAAGIAYGLRELKVYSATIAQLSYWGLVVAGATAILYAAIMFAMTWSFARAIGSQFLPALAFAIWGMVPVLNLLPFALLIFLANRRGGEDHPAASA